MFVGDVRNFTRSNSRSQREIQESLPPQARLQWSPGLFAPIWSASSHNLHPSSSSPLLPCSYRKILRLMFYCLCDFSLKRHGRPFRVNMPPGFPTRRRFFPLL
ncbi:hypothetical protein BFJ68_g17972 [Fusarium oxysporum]|uniref:Uncharacterized protein n=2 Tax=Fusarium oxysporum TaxID=5507 RepID=A0A420NAV0_FUSOX|nr:hypothetical protein BFJ65_g18475 [Fusarium oxysporum f. sp. cepae]RKK17365.1 hypothetical protein BFJ67_g17701 [Fusarium oxysporum f. sp. cepae]RKK21203.1 hypothetical protein BFJ66_g17679 [Fusarium oxysporum f. sp. cepae]RKK77395.1 hypothetical protein BFJ68_g17972 [Fusarium oxysporum]